MASSFRVPCRRMWSGLSSHEFRTVALLPSVQIGDPGSASRVLAADAEYNQSHRAVQDAFGGSEPFMVVAEGDERDALERVGVLRTIESFQRALERTAVVGASFSLVDILKSMGQLFHELEPRWAVIPEEEPAIRTMVSAGPEVWCRTHSPPSRRAVAAGDVMYVDCCGVVNCYHVDVCRTFAIGRDHPQARAILEQTAGSVAAVIDAVRPGDPLDVAQRVAEEYVYSRCPREQVWWVGGYALGIAMPPSWVGHTYLANDAFEQFTWEPGYVTNYENILFGWDKHVPHRNGRRTGYAASYMETLLMTESGIEVLSRLPRTLTVIGG